MALLRLLPLEQGRIILDGVDISLAPTSIIRNRCFITIPQESFLMSKLSLRQNLDYEEIHCAKDIVDVLRQTHLWQHFEDCNEGSESMSSTRILESPLSALPPLSAGHLQLFALSRAVLSAIRLQKTGSRPVILLDEPSASLDAETAHLLAHIVQECFTDKGHTVIMVTHSAVDALDHFRPDLDIVVDMRDGQLEVIRGGKKLSST